MNFQFSDTWLLHSIFNTEKQDDGAAIKDIIAFSDYTNHSIMNYEEFISGVEKLISVGLVFPIAKNYKTSELFREWCSSKFNKKIRMNVAKEFNVIENYLSTNFSKTTPAIKANLSIKYSEKDYKKKIAEYYQLA